MWLIVGPVTIERSNSVDRYNNERDISYVLQDHVESANHDSSLSQTLIRICVIAADYIKTFPLATQHWNFSAPMSHNIYLSQHLVKPRLSTQSTP